MGAECMKEINDGAISKVVLFCLIKIPLVLIFGIGIYSAQRVNLFGDAIPLATEPYTAEPDSVGYSTIKQSSLTEKGLHFAAELGTKSTQPIAGIIITPAQKLSFDFSTYEYLTIKLDSGSSRFNFTMTVFEKGFSDSVNTNSHRYLQLEHTVSQGKSTITVPLKSLPTPVFWYLMNNTHRERFSKADFSAVTSLIFSNHPAEKSGTPFNLEIREISFSRSYKPFWILLGVTILFWILTFVVFKLRTKRVKILLPEGLTIPADQFEEKLFLELQNSLGDTGLTIEKLALRCGVSVSRIRKTILAKAGISFSEYLREQRLAESCRLLSLTDLEIKEIAHRSGFAHSSSFTRAFREKFTISPTEFRLQSRSKKF